MIRFGFIVPTHLLFKKNIQMPVQKTHYRKLISNITVVECLAPLFLWCPLHPCGLGSISGRVRCSKINISIFFILFIITFQKQ